MSSSEGSNVSGVDLVENAVAEKFNDLPASTPSEADDKPHHPVKTRLFNRERSLHEIFGGGKAADTVLWKNKFMAGGILVGATIVYLILEHSGYTLLSIISNLLLVTFGVLFVWSNAAAFLNRSPPPLPGFYISEEQAKSLALALSVEINKALAAAHEIALGKDLKQFLKVMGVLWGLSIVGGWFHFLTLVYLAIVVAHTIPAVYDTYEDQIEHYLKYGYAEAQKQYKKVDENVFSKVFNAFPKLKKSD
ncbi:hypothetical protein KP509_02G059800 [Ceratopteris richardii]|uniref:Reticulon-like protein n=2 Tax=Ceratopteris richardii TaxID=49495 RepID=A0A8T2VE45_CERRI|nr:hypothetical protein KP509_02G059800 [Ceratopteris richardii]KAH7444003.1 hypothetical protein KP509_02G059800 [Ceratopteris richardii]KAH7444004.1 hypothetical protein KP509_02G059800 [Ceratopteris richardii]